MEGNMGGGYKGIDLSGYPYNYSRILLSLSLSLSLTHTHTHTHTPYVRNTINWETSASKLELTCVRRTQGTRL